MTHLTHPARIALIAVAAATFLLLPSCSDDEGESSSDTTAAADGATTSPSAPIVGRDGEVDVEALDAALKEAILAGDEPVIEPELEVQTATLDLVTIGPVEGDDAELTAEEADLVCGAVTSFLYRELPTVSVEIVDAEGTVLVQTEAAGACTTVDAP